MVRVEQQWEDRYVENSVVWKHPGRQGCPHALLTSGRHSSKYTNNEIFMQNARDLHDAGSDLTEKLREAGCALRKIDWVVGPSLGAVRLIQVLAYHIGRSRLHPCKTAIFEIKDFGGGGKRAISGRGQEIPAGARCLLVDDASTTGGSNELVADGVQRTGGIALPWFAVLVNQSGQSVLHGRQVVSLVKRPIPAWLPNECEVCRLDPRSIAIRPKAPANWQQLIQNGLVEF